MTPSTLDGTIQRLRAGLKKYGEAIPGLWKAIEEFRLRLGGKWPSWCFAPIELVRALLVDAAQNSGFRNPQPALTDLVATTLLAAWRTTQGIYVFDPDVENNLWETSISGDLPSEVLFHLPEWCCFVSTQLTVFGEDILGFFVSLNKDSEELPPELWLLVVYKGDTEEALEPLCLTLTGTLTEAIAGGLAKLERTTFATDSGLKAAALERLRTRYVTSVKDLSGMISLTLYLAAEDREISNTGGEQSTHPKPTKTKRGPKLFPPPAPKRWDVGLRLGSALRQAQRLSEEAREASPGGAQRASPRGHIRRAHWHSFWSGSRSAKQALRVKWLPPTSVNLTDVEDLPATIHKVKAIT